MKKRKKTKYGFQTALMSTKRFLSSNKLFVIMTISIVIVDKFTKILVKNTFIRGESVRVLGDFFKLTFIENKGIAFGLFADWQHPVKTVLFLFLSIAALLFIGNIYIKSNKSKLIQVSFGLIFGGAFGNIYDRLIYRRVVDFMNFDFFDIHIPGFHLLGIQFSGFDMVRWPIWNVADAAITVGVVFIMILILFKKEDI